MIFLDIPARLSICALQRWLCSLSGASSSGSTSKEMRSNQASTLGPRDAIKKAPMRLDSQKIGSMVIHHHPESLLCWLCHDLQIPSDSKVRRTGHFGQTGCLDRPRLSARTRKEAAAAATWHLGKERCNDNKRYQKNVGVCSVCSSQNLPLHARYWFRTWHCAIAHLNEISGSNQVGYQALVTEDASRTFDPCCVP